MEIKAVNTYVYLQNISKIDKQYCTLNMHLLTYTSYSISWETLVTDTNETLHSVETCGVAMTVVGVVRETLILLYTCIQIQE